MNIVLSLAAPLLPDGCHLNVTLDTNHKYEQQFADLLRAIRFVHDEADISRAATPGERTLSSRLDKIETAIVQGLPAAAKLDIANEHITRRT